MEKRYETVFILTPVLSDDQAKEAAKKFEKILTDLGAKINHSENWGLKKLAYPIHKKTTGFYHLVDFSGKGTEIAELELQFKRDERILRFLTIALEKHGATWADKRRGKLSEAKVAKTKKAEA
jgi:small subunit ribosomal protein S6